MKSAIIQRTALVLTTTPPFPREYGNRNRVFQTIQFLRDSGFKISLLLYPLDEDWVAAIPDYYRRLVDGFDYFAVVPHRTKLHRKALAYHHTVDEWWDDSIGEYLSWLFTRRSFDVFLVNYTFMSKAFDFAPSRTVKVLDTHDIFTGRREAFERHNVAEEFFYTNANEEKIAFDRSDAVLGIKSSESELIRGLTKSHVVTVPYWSPINEPLKTTNRERKFNHERPLKIGFIGAENSVNVVNMRRFLHIFDRYVRLYNLPVVVVIAGNVCRQLHSEYPCLIKLGRIPDVTDFYWQVDAVVAPLEFSTGIKIKVGEALAWELPVVATANAFDGFRAFHSSQTEPTVSRLCETLTSLSLNEIPYHELVIAAKRAARAAARAHDKGFMELHRWIRQKMRRIFVVTDRPFWYRGTFLDESITQTIEYVSKAVPTIVLTMCNEKVHPSSVYAEAEYVMVEDGETVATLLRESSVDLRIQVLLLLERRAIRDSLVESLGHHDIPCFIGRFFEGPFDQLQFCVGASKPPFGAPPLRYLPIGGSSKVEPRRVNLYHRENISEWGQSLLDYVTESTRELGLKLQCIKIPGYSQFSSNFMTDALRDSAERVVILDCDKSSQVVVHQVSQFRGASCLIVAEDFACPEAFDDVTNSPSLTRTIDNFLQANVSAQWAAGANSGWAKLWAALDLQV